MMEPFAFVRAALLALATTFLLAPHSGEAEARLEGRVIYRGADPDRRLRMDADPVCAGTHGDPVYSESIVAGPAGELANVLVYIKGVLSGPLPPPSARAAVLEQAGCVFRPHVLALRTGQQLVIRNQDPTLHNVHARARANPSFNLGQPFQGLETVRTFSRPEVVPFKCDIHPWMSAYVGVFDHPYFAVTGRDGSFRLRVPAGTHVVEAWHETLATRNRRVTLSAQENVRLEFSFSP